MFVNSQGLYIENKVGFQQKYVYRFYYILLIDVDLEVIEEEN